MKKSILISMMALSLVACGGGSEDNGTGAGGTSISPSNYVSGQFKDAYNTGEYFIKSGNGLVEQEFGNMSKDCVSTNNFHYFESNRVMVYGSPSFDDDEFKKVATFVENNIDFSMSAMNTNFTDFMNNRSSIAKFAVRRAVSAIDGIDSVQKPLEYEDMDYDEKNRWSFRYFNSLSGDNQVSLLKEIFSASGEGYQEVEFKYKKKIYVCMNKMDSGSNLGEGNKLGLGLSVPAIYNTNTDNLIQHELIHTIQEGLIHSIHGIKLPRWYAEGQAVYLSGQEIANHSEHNDVNVPYFVSAFDERGYDIGNQYKHYGLAYKYLQDANGIEKMMSIISNMQSGDYLYAYSKLPVGYDFDSNRGAPVEDPSFIVAFDEAGIKKKNGEVMNLDHWKYDYNQIMEEN